MKHIYILFVVTIYFITSCFICSAQPTDSLPAPNSINSHKQFITILKSSEDRSFNQILQQYDTYLTKYPNDINTHIEKCQFLGKALYNEYDEYNPNQEKFDSCVNELYHRFPSQPDVLLYKLEFLYQDSAIAFATKILQMKEDHPAAWKDKPIWKVYEQLANQHSYKDEHQQTILFTQKAMAENDTLDLSLVLARAYKALHKNKEAAQLLRAKLDSLQPDWILNQKAELLLELGEVVSALKAFRYAQKDSTNWVNASSIGKALEKNNQYNEARNYFVKAVQRSPEDFSAHENLFLHDLHYQCKDSVLASYTALRNLGYTTDPFGRHRIALFLNHPFIPWQWRDLLGISVLFLISMGMFLVPYVWVLPIYFTGTYFKITSVGKAIPFRWGLTSFWLISLLYLFVSFFVLLLYNHTDLTAYFSENTFLAAEEVPEAILAKTNLLFMLLLAIGTFCFLKKSDYTHLWGTQWTIRQSLVRGFLAALAVKFIYGWSFVLLVSIFPDIAQMGKEQMEFFRVISSIDAEIVAINHEYGFLISFLLVVILVPIYEEVIFRGIILSSCEKYIPFFWANLFQAFLFGLIHQKPIYFVFYLAIGMLSGYLCKNSKGLASSIALHMANNFFAFMAIARYS